jgi:gamma-butyrobetaine dioxygenase
MGEGRSAVEFIDHLAQLFEVGAGAQASADGLSNAAHMLQTAAAARAAGVHDALVAAALLHDVGHWLRPSQAHGKGGQGDAHHEILGAEHLAQYFGKEVTEPVRMHVAAKRYLCAREPAHLAALSLGSTRSLELQGGPMSDAEAKRFEQSPGHQDAVSLRRWDEYGKSPSLEVPPFAKYRDLLSSLMRHAST